MFRTSSDRAESCLGFASVAGGIGSKLSPFLILPTQNDTVLYAIDRTETAGVRDLWRTGITLWHAMVGRILTGYGR